MVKKIFLFSRDPGGANTIFPLVKSLESKNYKVLLYGKDSALNIYEKNGLSGKDITLEIEHLAFNSVFTFLEDINPDFIITGTSGNDFTERYIWESAKKMNIKSFAILDQWINYGIRFSQYSTSDISKYESSKNHIYLPTRILTMDDYSKKELIDCGFDESIILVSGQPYFDFLIDKSKMKNKSEIYNFKKYHNCEEDEILVTFASEPISSSYTDEKTNYWGYNENSIIQEIIESFRIVLRKRNLKLKLIIRPHPRENIENLINTIKNNDYSYPSIIIDNKFDSLTAILSSDIVMGISSMFLIEAAVLGREIISVQIGLKTKNPFVLHNKGFTRSILNRSDLINKLEDILESKNKEKKKLDLKYGSVEKVIKLMEEFF